MKTIAITGASSGIGGATALRFARGGDAIALVMTTESGFATRASGPRQSPDDVAEAIHRAVARPVPEVYPYRKAKWLAVMAAVAPSFADGLVQKWGRNAIQAAE